MVGHRRAGKGVFGGLQEGGGGEGEGGCGGGDGVVPEGVGGESAGRIFAVYGGGDTSGCGEPDGLIMCYII